MTEQVKSTTYSRGYSDGYKDAISGKPRKISTKNDQPNIVQAAEVDWYRRNGLHPTRRIAKDTDGCEYVIGDQSWRHIGPREDVEAAMKSALMLDVATPHPKEGGKE